MKPLITRTSLLAAVCLLVVALLGGAAAWLRTAGNRDVLYLRRDGTFAMGSATRTPATPQEICDRLRKQGMWPGRIVIDAAPDGELQSIAPLLNATGELGIAAHQLRVRGTALNFLLPGCPIACSRTAHPIVVDLRHNPAPPPEGLYSLEVQVLIDDSITFHELIDGVRPYLGGGASMEIRGKGACLLRFDGIDKPRKSYPNPWHKPSAIQRLIGYLKDLFPGP